MSTLTDDLKRVLVNTSFLPSSVALAGAQAVMLAMVELIDATVRTFDSGKVMNCAFDCEYEGAHPNCSACNALARLKAEVLKAQTGGGK